MSFSWTTINHLLRVATLGAIALCGVSDYAVVLRTPPKPTLEKESGAVIAPTTPSPLTHYRLTLDEIAAIGAIRLQRMNPPKPEPPPMVLIAEVKPEPPKPTEAPLFNGVLLGTIEDSDPRYSFAILRWPDGKITIRAYRMPIDDRPNSPVVDEIQSTHVVLRDGARQQTLKRLENP